MRGGRQLVVLLAAPAAAQLAASPVSAAAPSRHVAALCLSGGAGSALLPGADPFDPSGPRKRAAQLLCAHALCPRDQRLGRRIRPGP
jgi:hypothetical protein